MTALYRIDGEGLECEGPEPQLTANGRHPSVAYFCAACGRVWARITIPGEGFIPQCMPCEACPPVWSNRPAGSLWMDWDQPLCAVFPEPILRREARLHMDFFERKLTS